LNSTICCEKESISACKVSGRAYIIYELDN
jgi:hypothetical protein